MLYPHIIESIDFGQRTVEDTYVDPIIRLSFNIRESLDCDTCRQTMLELGEKDLATIRDTPEPERTETAEAILSEWEARAEERGLRGWAEEGMYWIGWAE
jgi:cytidine deaminase